MTMLSEAERHRVLVEWNETGCPAPTDLGIAAVFEAQATRTPNAIAVEHHGLSLTYDALDGSWEEMAIDKRPDCPTCGQT